MSQKKEKYARSIEARVSEVEQRMDETSAGGRLSATTTRRP